MTLGEMERGFELHEKRLGTVAETLVNVSQRLDRVTKLAEGHEERLGRVEENLPLMQKNSVVVQENLTVQGGLLNLLDQRLDRVALMLEGTQQQRAEDRASLRIMQGAMTALFERMDAFI